MHAFIPYKYVYNLNWTNSCDSDFWYSAIFDFVQEKKKK